MRALTIAALLSVVSGLSARAVAQESAKSSDVVLLCEVAKDGHVVARPSLRIASGQTGSLSYRDELTATVTPTRLRANEVRLALTIEAAGRTIKPEIKIGEQPARVSFRAGKETYELTFARRAP